MKNTGLVLRVCQNPVMVVAGITNYLSPENKLLQAVLVCWSLAGVLDLQYYREATFETLSETLSSIRVDNSLLSDF